MGDKSLDVYRSYHQNKWNKLTHKFGVPLATLAVLIFLGWFRLRNFDLPLVSSATLFVLGCLVFYYKNFGAKLAFKVGVMNFILLMIADSISRMELKASITYFAVIFIVGWSLQFLGHYIEGKRPALFDNIGQIFSGPVFILMD